ALERFHQRRDLESLLDGAADARAHRFRIDRALDLDENPDTFATGGRLGLQYRLEVEHVGIAEHEVFEVGVIDVDAANLEKPGGAIGVPDHRKKFGERPGTGRIGYIADQIARIPAQE